MTPLSRAFAATRHFRPVLIILITLIVVFAITQAGFRTSANLRTMLSGVSILWVVSLGMTFVLISGGVDLSAGAIIALCGLVLAWLLDLGVPAGFAIPLTVMAGALVGGAVNGLLIGRLRLSFFVVTLASMTAVTGVVNLWTDTQTRSVLNPLIGNIGMGTLAGLAVPVWIMIVTFLGALYVQQRTYLGRDIYATGGSITAARLSGIRTERTLVIVYAVSGACAAIGSLIAVGRIGAASPQIDNTVALQAAAAVLLGGTSLTGGAGGVGGTAFGVLFIGVLQNGLSIAGVPSFWQQVVTGVILVSAVLGDRLAVGGGLRRRLRRGPDDPGEPLAWNENKIPQPAA
ncbi:MAG: rbsC [Streptosporangiaceae bacterium]|jgi:ribose transport system permease protein|nr:rbsC [Streptosporangiaceae bacterium]